MKLREAAQQALEYIEQHAIISGIPIRDALRAALAEDRSADTGKTSDHFADAGKMVATSQEYRHVEPVAWIGCLEGGIEYGTYHKAALKLPDGVRFDLYTAPVVATERERIAAWVEDMCVGLDAKTIANGIRNNGNDDIRAFEVRK
jgi:hypothetical protein